MIDINPDKSLFDLSVSKKASANKQYHCLPGTIAIF